MRSVVMLGLVALAATACGSSGGASGAAAKPTVPASAPVAGSGDVATDSADGFAIALPADFYAVSSTTTAAQLRSKGVAVANLAQLLTATQGVIPPGVKFLATDFASASSGFADNINLVVENVSAGTNVQAEFDKLEPALASQGLKVSNHRNVSAAGRPALEVGYTFMLGNKNVQGTQLYVVKGGELFIVTLSERVRNAAVAEAVIAGMHFTS